MYEVPNGQTLLMLENLLTVMLQLKQYFIGNMKGQNN